MELDDVIDWADEVVADAGVGADVPPYDLMLALAIQRYVRMNMYRETAVH